MSQELLNLLSTANCNESEILQYIQEATIENIDETNETGMSALHLAAKKGFTDIADALAQQGANINLQDESGKTPLMTALHESNETTALALINDTLEVDLVDKNKLTALHFAALLGFPNIAKALLKLGANINLQDENQKTPLMRALWGKHETTALALINDTLEVDLLDTKQRTALNVAARQGCTDIVNALVNQGADTNTVDRYGYTPLIAALKYEHTATALVLINAGATCDANLLLDSSSTSYLFAMLSHSKLHAAPNWDSLSKIKFKDTLASHEAQKINYGCLRMRGETELSMLYKKACTFDESETPLKQLWRNLLQEKPLDRKAEDVSFVLHLFANATQEARDVAYRVIIEHLKTHALNKPATSKTQALTSEAMKEAASDRLNAHIAQHLKDQPFLAYELLSYAFYQQDCDATEIMMKAAIEDGSLYPEKHAALLDRLVDALFSAEDNYTLTQADEHSPEVSLFETNAARLQKMIVYSLALIHFPMDSLTDTAKKQIDTIVKKQLELLSKLLICILPHAHEITTNSKQNPLHLLAIHCPAALDDYKFSSNLNACNMKKLNDALKQNDVEGNTPLAYAEESGNKKLISMYQSWVDAAGTETHSYTSSIEDVLAETPPAIRHSTPETASEIAELNVTPSTSSKTNNKNRAT